MLIVLLLVDKHDIDHRNLLFRTHGAKKNGLEAKNPYYEAQKVTFLILGHRDLSRSGPYYGFLYSLISTNYHVGMSPSVPALGLIQLENRFFLATWRKLLSVVYMKGIGPGS